MAPIKRSVVSWLPLFILVIVSATLAGESLPPVAEWVPDKVTTVIPADRTNPYTILEWKRKPIIRSTDRFTVLAFEAELVFPELKRVGAERYYPTNKLGHAEANNLPKTCYYQDNYYKDFCENWTLGIKTSPECLLSILPSEVKISYFADPLPPEATTGRYQVQTVGIDRGSDTSYIGPTSKAELIGLGCSTFCSGCFATAKAPLVGDSLKKLCVELARKIENPYATWEWMEAFCPSCEAAKNESVEWQYFRADQAVCVEPVTVPGTSEGKYCSRSTYSDGCDPVNQSPRICQPGATRCVGKNVETCSLDATGWSSTMSCEICCRDNMCQGTRCTPSSSFCIDQNMRRTCSSDGCGAEEVKCECGCDNGVCLNKICTASYCRDADTQILCSPSGCSTSTVRCGYGCKNGQCQGSGGSPSDMSTTLPDMAVPPPPPDLATVPPGVEVCDGKDNNGNGQVDELPSCWLTVYRFRDPTSNARCYGPTNIAPPVCTGYVFEKELFTVPSSPSADGTTNERVQCSSGANHIITIKNGGEHTTLQASGWSCNVSLGYWFQTGTGKTAGTPYSFTCPVYRTWFTTSSGTSHIFSSHTESFAGTFTCEPPTRGDVVQNMPCGRPSGC